MSAIVETCLYLVGTRTHPHLPVCQYHYWNISGQGTNGQRHSPSHCQTCCLQTSWAQSHPRIQPCPAVGLGPSPVHKLFNKPTSTHSIRQLDSTSLRMPWPSALHTTSQNQLWAPWAVQTEAPGCGSTQQQADPDLRTSGVPQTALLGPRPPAKR